MSEFCVITSGLFKETEVWGIAAREIQSKSEVLNSIRSSLSITGSAAESVKQSLKQVSKQMEEIQNASIAVQKALADIISSYEKTERKIKGRKVSDGADRIFLGNYSAKEDNTEDNSFVVNGVEYREGEPSTPQIEFDNDYPYDPDFRPTWEDYMNYMKWQVLLRGAQELMYLPDGCKTYSHYLYGNGETISVDYEKAYRQDRAVQASVDSKINEAISAAVQYYNASGKSDFSLTGGPTSSNYPETENWQKAIGGHTLWNSMDVSTEGNIMTIELSVHELDRYNFDKGKADIATGTKDEVNGRFASAGWAHPFNTEGELHRTIEIDLSSYTENASMESESVKVTQKRNTKVGAPWEGEER